MRFLKYLIILTCLTGALEVSASWKTRYVHPVKVCQLYCEYCRKHVGQDEKLSYDLSRCENECEEKMGVRPDKTCTNEKYIKLLNPTDLRKNQKAKDGKRKDKKRNFKGNRDSRCGKHIVLCIFKV